MIGKLPVLSLIIPVFNEEDVLEYSFSRMDAAMKECHEPYEMIYVNDGSKDSSMHVLRALAAAHPYVKVFSFSRNFGHQAAVTCGMDHAQGDALVIIDVDLQDPPELIPQMVQMWRDGSDIVYGKRKKRDGETLFKKITASAYYRLLSSMSAYPIPLDTGDFRLLDRKVADTFLRMREHNRFLRGMSAWMGYEATPLEYERKERAAGKTKYTLRKMLRLAVDGIVGFSDTPLLLPGYIGAAVCTITFFGLIALIVCAFCFRVAPWLWAAADITLLFGITLCCMGLHGLYLSRLLDEGRNRPLYLIADALNDAPSDSIQ